MSGTTPVPTPTPTLGMRDLMIVGAIVVSVINSLAFSGALVMAFMSKDTTNLGLLVGAVIANFSTVVSFWVGSSAGSMKKTQLLADKITPHV